ncbi:hypothetical protein [Roseomonas chloroacetimidivorans]|uniref:hypothetical protein n=1 Tax=Roseomonas chloroacetimidivorans TaxID=1766656 RepID=UPI003C73F11E
MTSPPGQGGAGRGKEMEHLLRALDVLPDLIVREVPAGVAISTSAWVKRDGDRCGVYAVLRSDGWRIEDDGLTMVCRDGMLPPVIAAAGARLDEEEVTLFLPVPNADALPAAVVQMMALLWRLDAAGVPGVEGNDG